MRSGGEGEDVVGEEEGGVGEEGGGSGGGFDLPEQQDVNSLLRESAREHMNGDGGDAPQRSTVLPATADS